MVVPDGGHLAVLVLLCLWYIVRTSITGSAGERLLRELGECGGREWSDDVCHGVPRPADERASLFVVVGVELAGVLDVPCAVGGHYEEETGRKDGNVRKAAGGLVCAVAPCWIGSVAALNEPTINVDQTA